MAVLHQVLGGAGSALGDCFRFCRSGDTVCLIDDGVGVLADTKAIAPPPGVRLLCLRRDAAARGLVQAAARSDVETIRARDWAALLAAHERVLSWL